MATNLAQNPKTGLRLCLLALTLLMAPALVGSGIGWTGGQAFAQDEDEGDAPSEDSRLEELQEETPDQEPEEPKEEPIEDEE